MITQFTQCRYLRRNDEQCTAEALDDSPDAEVVLCGKHAARVMVMVRQAAGTTVRAKA